MASATWEAGPAPALRVQRVARALAAALVASACSSEGDPALDGNGASGGEACADSPLYALGVRVVTANGDIDLTTQLADPDSLKEALQRQGPTLIDVPLEADFPVA